MRLKNCLITSRGFVPVLITSQHWFEFWTPNRLIRKVTLSFTPYSLCFHPPIPLSEETPRRGGRQQPHQALKKFKKYKGGKKCHLMVAQSSPKMPK
jgi:hypothetical protein